MVIFSNANTLTFYKATQVDISVSTEEISGVNFNEEKSLIINAYNLGKKIGEIAYKDENEIISKLRAIKQDDLYFSREEKEYLCYDDKGKKWLFFSIEIAAPYKIRFAEATDAHKPLFFLAKWRVSCIDEKLAVSILNLEKDKK